MSNTQELKRWLKAIIQNKISSVNSCEVTAGTIPDDLVQGKRLPAVVIFEEGTTIQGINNRKFVETDFSLMIIAENQQDVFGEAASQEINIIVAAIIEELSAHKWLSHTARVETAIDADVAVDKGGGEIGIPITGHSYNVDDFVIIEGSTYYSIGGKINPGGYLITSETANEIVIYPAKYKAETFDGATVTTIDKVFMKVMSIGNTEYIDIQNTIKAVLGKQIKIKIYYEVS